MSKNAEYLKDVLEGDNNDALKKFRDANREFVDTHIIPQLNSKAKSLFANEYNEGVLKIKVGEKDFEIAANRLRVKLCAPTTLAYDEIELRNKTKSFVRVINWFAERGFIVFGIIACGFGPILENGERVLNLYCFSHSTDEQLNELIEKILKRRHRK